MCMTPEKRLKSASQETNSAPCSMASAARCASEVRFPAVPRANEQALHDFQVSVPGRYDRRGRSGEPQPHALHCSRGRQRRQEDLRFCRQTKEYQQDIPGEADQFVPVQSPFEPAPTSFVLKRVCVLGVQQHIRVDDFHRLLAELHSPDELLVFQLGRQIQGFVEIDTPAHPHGNPRQGASAVAIASDHPSA